MDEYTIQDTSQYTTPINNHVCSRCGNIVDITKDDCTHEKSSLGIKVTWCYMCHKPKD